MNPYLSVLCVYICITICSTEKLKSGGKLSVKEKRDKDALYNARPTFKTKEDIPADYLEKLVEHHDISEDPLGDKEREEKKFREEHGYNYFYDEDDSNIYTTAIDKEDDSIYNYITKDDTEQDKESIANKTEANATCKTCEMHEREKLFRLEQIKQTLLFKLGFSSNNLPNASRKSIPNIPVIKRLMESHEMQGDAPYPEDDYIPEDEIYGQVKRAYTIAQTSKFLILLDML